MKILLVEPKYYTAYPPLPLLKLAAFHKKRGDQVQLVRGCEPKIFSASKVFITSLFTYAWVPVQEAVAYYRAILPRAKITLGGIYASLMPEHALENCRPDELVTGLVGELEKENLLPDYSLVATNWPDTSIVFASRGCIRKCPYCAVPKMEGSLKGRSSIKGFIWPGHKKVIFWDNNFLAIDNWPDILEEARALNLGVDFNQGLDARLITKAAGHALKQSKVNLVRLAYDKQSQKKSIQKAVGYLKEAGYDGRRIFVYMLYNFRDDPEDFWLRMCDLMELGVAAYPMRFERLNSLEKNHYVSPHWTREAIEMVAKAQRVIGYGGAFPPYRGLIDKITLANDFFEAFELRPRKKK